LVIILVSIIGVILFFGAYFYNKRVRLVLICTLMRKYSIESTVTCIRREKALKRGRERMAYRILKKQYPEADKMK
jgi:hypothetical protein